MKKGAQRSRGRKSGIICEALERQRPADENQSTAYERFKKAGLMGVARTAPAHLSTNRKYLDGFGR